MYWGDASTQRIEAANIDGSGRRFIRLDQHAIYIAFALHAGIIYYTNWHTPYAYLLIRFKCCETCTKINKRENLGQCWL